MSVVGWPWLVTRCPPKLLCNSPSQLDRGQKIEQASRIEIRTRRDHSPTTVIGKTDSTLGSLRQTRSVTILAKKEKLNVWRQSLALSNSLYLRSFPGFRQEAVMAVQELLCPFFLSISNRFYKKREECFRTSLSEEPLQVRWTQFTSTMFRTNKWQLFCHQMKPCLVLYTAI